METVADNPFTPDYKLEWSDESCVWSVTPKWASGAAEGAREVYHGQDLEFELVAPTGRLDQLWLRLSTFERSNTAHLWVEFREMSGRVLRRAYIDPLNVIDGMFHCVLDLRPLVLRAGAKYRVYVSSPTGRKGDAMGLWVASSADKRDGLVKRLDRFRNHRSFLRHVRHDSHLQSPVDPAATAILVAVEPLSGRTGRMMRALSRMFPGQSFEIVQATALTELWPVVSKADAVFFLDVLDPDAQAPNGFNALCFELYRRGVCTIFVDDVSLPDKIGTTTFSMSPLLALREREQLQLRRCCQYTLLPDDLVLFESQNPAIAVEEILRSEKRNGLLGRLVRYSRAPHSPRFCIVSSLGDTADAVNGFITHVIEQTYPGSIELVLVNDGSSQSAVDCARSIALRLRFSKAKDRLITVVDAPNRPGAPDARLVGLQAAEAHIYAVVEHGSMIHPDWVAAHVFEHACAGVDVVTGPSDMTMGFADMAVFRRRSKAALDEMVASELPLIDSADLLGADTGPISMKSAIVQSLCNSHGFRAPETDAHLGVDLRKCTLMSMGDVQEQSRA